MVSVVRLATFPRIPLPLGSGLELPKEELEQDWRGNSKVFRGAWQVPLSSLSSTPHLALLPNLGPADPRRSTTRLFRGSNFPQTHPQLPSQSHFNGHMGSSSQISLQVLTCPPRPVLKSFLKGMTPSLILQLHFLDLLVP